MRAGENRILCTPTGMSKGFMQPGDICVVDLDGNVLEKNPNGREPTSELLLHLAVYRKRDDVAAVVHCHPAHVVAFCLARRPLPEGLHPEAEIFLGRTVFAPYATPGGHELPDSFIDRLTDETTTILLANHGSVNLGRDLFEAYYRLEILDKHCQQIILTHQIGEPQPLNDEQVAELRKARQRFS